MSRTLNFTIGGHRRLVIVHVPTRWNSSTPIPLVLNLHGSGDTASHEEVLTGMDVTANRDRFIVAYPQALVPLGSGFVWNVPGVPLVEGGPIPRHDVNDVAFLTALVGTLERYYCLDTSRVYVTGFSRGARMSSQLACDDSSIFAAAAMVSGVRRPTPCPTVRPVPVLAIHGTADQTNPYDGSTLPMWSYSVIVAAQRWGNQDRCAMVHQFDLPSYSLIRYSQCSGGAAVELYSLYGGGHVWPVSPIRPFVMTGTTGLALVAANADQVIWDFLKVFKISATKSL